MQYYKSLGRIRIARINHGKLDHVTSSPHTRRHTPPHACTDPVLSVVQIYGFDGEVKAKYNQTMVEVFRETFNAMPLAYVINSRVIVLHGGLFSRDDVTLDDLRAIDRFREPPDEGLMCEVSTCCYRRQDGLKEGSGTARWALYHMNQMRGGVCAVKGASMVGKNDAASRVREVDSCHRARPALIQHSGAPCPLSHTSMACPSPWTDAVERPIATARTHALKARRGRVVWSGRHAQVPRAQQAGHDCTLARSQGGGVSGMGERDAV